MAFRRAAARARNCRNIARFANAGYGFGKLPDGNPDRFRVRLVDRPALRIAYVRVIGGYDATMLRAGFDRLMTWGRARGIMPGATLIGMSCDAPEVTPMKNTHFDWCMVLPSGFEADRRVDVGMIPANRFAIVRMRGDLHKEDRAWNYLFHSWLPRSGYEPTPGPALEVYRRTPLELGWSEFDMDCYLPVKPLRS
jgi:AraC family transcriptional regulator